MSLWDWFVFWYDLEGDRYLRPLARLSNLQIHSSASLIDGYSKVWWWSSSVDDVILVSIELNSTSVLWCHPSSCLNPSRFWVVDGKLLFIHLINSSTLPPFHLSISLTSLSSHLLDFNQQSLFKNVIMPSCQFLSHHHHLLPLLLLLPGLLPFPSSSPKKQAMLISFL